MKTEIEDIIRSTLVIQNKQSLGLCAEKIVKYFKDKMEYDVFTRNKKIETPIDVMLNVLNVGCVHPYDNIEQNDLGQIVCKICNKILSE